MGQMQGRDAPSGQEEPGGQLLHISDLSAAANVPALHCLLLCCSPGGELVYSPPMSVCLSIHPKQWYNFDTCTDKCKHGLNCSSCCSILL